MRRPLTIAALCGALTAAAAPAAAVAAPAPAPAAAVERVCTRATVFDTPRGVPIGVLYEGTKVVVLRRDGARVWTRVRSSGPIVGWIRARALRGC